MVAKAAVAYEMIGNQKDSETNYELFDQLQERMFKT